jgi:hypothetical protein
VFGKKVKRVTVLGAGPTGLLAAHAAEQAGREVQVLTRPDANGNPVKSQLHGCQYLHGRIPSMDMPLLGAVVGYELIGGTDEEYRAKVYGASWNGKVSPQKHGGVHEAWDLRAAYDQLWDKWYPRIMGVNVEPAVIAGLQRQRDMITYCTIPAPVLCQNPEHKFLSRDVWAMGELDPRQGATNRELPYRAPDMTVQCNGAEAPRWYRAATVFGCSTLEWPDGPKPPVTGVARVSKPLSTDCDCHLMPRWRRLGRYGMWAKGVLTHEAYYRVAEDLA